MTQALTDPSWIEAMQDELLQFRLQKVWRLVNLPKGKHAIGTKWVYRNKKDERGIVVRNKAKVTPKKKEFIMMRVPFLYGTIEEEVYVCQPPSFEDSQFPDKFYKVYVDDIIFGSTKKSLCTEYESLMHKKLQMSSMGELTFLLGLQVMQRDNGIFISQDKYVADILNKFNFSLVKIASTPIETNKALHKDEEAEDVDVHLYRSMIGSLMYLTTSRPDIMFAVCACARFQVTPKFSHLHDVKRIFRYLKGQPKLGLWYPRDSPFDLEAFSDSDYAGASLDRISTTGGCQFLGKRLISWQCKKKTVVANSTTEAEYVAAANCCAQIFSQRLLMLAEVGKGSGQPTDLQHTSTSSQLSTEEPISVLSSSQLKRPTNLGKPKGPLRYLSLVDLFTLLQMRLSIRSRKTEWKGLPLLLLA
ncbi:putative ribonuclease H-like domain-containing protein [Tanacetum coccineum]